MGEFYFLSLASGSSGNCYYLGTSGYGFLIDAGISPTRIKRELKKHDIALTQVRGIFVTHEHADHAKYVGSLNKKYGVALYTTKRVYQGIMRNRNIAEKPDGCNFINCDEAMLLEEFSIEPFAVSHDTPECLGYSFRYAGQQFTIATDLGYVSDVVAQHIRSAHHLVIEANYDEAMLDGGRYPQFLKERVKSRRGHLSNMQAAQCLVETWSRSLQHIFLCHLSADNNTPTLAVSTILRHLQQHGIVPAHLAPLSRMSASELIVL